LIEKKWGSAYHFHLLPNPNGSFALVLAIDVATVDANLSKCSSHQDSATFDGIVKMTGSVDNEFNKPPNFLTLFRLSLLGAIM